MGNQMKILYCHKCKHKVGEIARGKILRDVYILCPKCKKLHESNDEKIRKTFGPGSVFENIFK
jgi:hypothetical protein